MPMDSITLGKDNGRNLGDDVEVTTYAGGTAGYSQLARYAKKTK